MSFFSIIATAGTAIPWKDVIKEAPRLVDSATKAYATIRDLGSRSRSGAQNRRADDNRTLRKEVTELQGHFEAQTALIAQMTQQGAALVRWVITLAVISVLIGAVAIASLVLAIVNVLE